ncbi:MAG TPA: ABC transporter ATP-binding protein [Vicinamibacterales bacterium]|nr:ABC transporter ATP-binding protein [Vicinamibacterales bacterium]
MSTALAIQLEQVAKRYRTGRSRTLVDLVASKVDGLFGRHDDMHLESRRVDATFWALRDVSLDVRQGVGLGIIGRNGAGKTTLLKLVSRVTWPTQGAVRVAGHVVSLIELGAGFHPELTGRENVYLGAGLFGLTRREVENRFDEIVDFAGVAALIDTPMKRYSSGLYARLGFSVAIFSRPDVVLVDEVLAVGDAPFRRRAVEALGRLIAEGKTVLFISHDLWNVRRLCTEILWLEEGRIRAHGPAAELTEQYLNEVNLSGTGPVTGGGDTHRGGTGEVRYVSVELTDVAGRPTRQVASNETLVVVASYRADEPVRSPVFHIAIIDVDTGVAVTTAVSSSSDSPGEVSALGTIECRFTHLPLRPRQYVLRLSITDTRQVSPYDIVSAGPRFAVTGPSVLGGLSMEPRDGGEDDGLVSLPYEFRWGCVEHIGSARGPREEPGPASGPPRVGGDSESSSAAARASGGGAPRAVIDDGQA